MTKLEIEKKIAEVKATQSDKTVIDLLSDIENFLKEHRCCKYKKCN